MKIKNTNHQNFWDIAKAVHRGKFITVIAYIRKEEISTMSNLSSYLSKLVKEEQTKSKLKTRNNKN